MYFLKGYFFPKINLYFSYSKNTFLRSCKVYFSDIAICISFISGHHFKEGASVMRCWLMSPDCLIVDSALSFCILYSRISLLISLNWRMIFNICLVSIPNEPYMHFIKSFFCAIHCIFYRLSFRLLLYWPLRAPRYHTEYLSRKPLPENTDFQVFFLLVGSTPWIWIIRLFLAAKTIHNVDQNSQFW